MNRSQALRLLFWSLAAASFAWAAVDPRFRDPEGYLARTFCLPIAGGMALTMLGWSLASPLKAPAGWLALAVVGQAVALQLIDAGPWIRYQHYKPLTRLLTETHPLLPIYLAGQTLLVVMGFRTRWPEIRAWTCSTFKVWQLLGIGLAFVLTSATVSRDRAGYIEELLFATFVQAVNLGNLVLMVLAFPEDALASLKLRIERLLGGSEQAGAGEVGGADTFPLIAALWVTVIAAVLNVFAYERHPHVPDEVVYLYHARTLASGGLATLAPPVPDAFDIYLMDFARDTWYSSVPPGWPLILALGTLARIPWLVNPLLAGVVVLLTYAFVRQLYGRRSARLSVLLMALSPWHVFMGMNFMPHTSTLAGALAASLAVSRARQTGKAMWGWVGGLIAGMVSLIRPMDGLLVAGLLALWAIGVGGSRLKTSCIAAFALGAIVVGAAVLPYNAFLTGDPAKFPIMVYTDKRFGVGSNALGFGSNRGFGWALDPFPGHGPLDALINGNLNISSINTELYGWSTGSLIMVVLLLFSGAPRRNDYLMLAVIVAVVGAYSFYWYSGGPDFGARYWYLILVPCLVFTVRGIEFLEERCGSRHGGSPNSGARVIVAVLALCMLTLVNYFPWRAIDKYHRYLGMRPDIPYLAKEHAFGKSLVLIRGNRHPDYASAAVYNPLDPRADAPVYAWDRNPEVRAQVLRAYQDRPVWIVNGPSITHRGFEVLQGPLSTQELMRNGEKSP